MLIHAKLMLFILVQSVGDCERNVSMHTQQHALRLSSELLEMCVSLKIHGSMLLQGDQA